MSVRTDDDGRYSIAWDANQGHRELYVSADGYGTQAHVVGEASTVDVVLAPGDSITGRAVDATGAPLANVLVASVPIGRKAGSNESDTSRVDRTGEDGRFTLGGIRRSLEHGVVLTREGVGRYVLDVAPRPEGPGTVDLGDVVLPAPRRIEGRVVGADGSPVQDAPVSLKGANADRRRLIGTEGTGASSYGQTEEAYTDHLGRFRFADLSAGTYVLTLRAAGRASASRTIVLMATADVLDADLILAPAREIVIRVRDAEGTPLAGAHIAIRDAKNERISGQTDPEGSLRVFVPLGQWSLSVSPLEDESWGGTRRFLPVGNRPIEPDATEVVVTFEEAHLVEGVVRTDRGEPVVSARITASEWGKVLGTASSDPTGRFTVRVPKDAVVDVRASWKDTPAPAPDGTASPALWRAERTGVRAGTVDLVLALAPVPQDRVLAFRVLSPEGLSHPGARIPLSATSGDGGSRSATTDAEGRAVFEGLTDELWSGIAFPDRAHAMEWVAIRIDPLDPRVAGTNTAVVLTFRVGVNVDGRVLSGDGHGVDDIQVEVLVQELPYRYL